MHIFLTFHRTTIQNQWGNGEGQLHSGFGKEIALFSDISNSTNSPRVQSIASTLTGEFDPSGPLNWAGWVGRLTGTCRKYNVPSKLNLCVLSLGKRDVRRDLQAATYHFGFRTFGSPFVFRRNQRPKSASRRL